MNQNTRYEIRISAQLKDDFLSCGGNAEIVRALMEDYIVRRNNDLMANENSNAIGNLSIPIRTDNKSVHYDELVDTKTRQVLKPFKVIEIRSGRLVRTYKPKQFVKKAFLNKKLFKLEVDLNEKNL